MFRKNNVFRKNPVQLFSITFLSIFLLALPRLPPVSAALPQEAYDQIRVNLTNFFGTVGYKDIDRYRPTLQSDGKFSGITYKEGDIGKGIKEHARRDRALVQDDLDKLGDLSDTLKKSIRYLAFDIPEHKDTNRWTSVIGIPTVVYPLIFFAYDHLDSVVRDKLIDRYFVSTDFGPVWNKDEQHGKFTGGNTAPRALVGLVHYFLIGKLESFNVELREVLHRELIERDVYRGNGFKLDGCLHQHNPIIVKKMSNGENGEVVLDQIFNNKYGVAFLKFMGMLMDILDNTPLDLGDELEIAVYGLFFECEQWLYRGHSVEPTTVGFALDNGEEVTYAAGAQAVLLMMTYYQHVGRLQSDVTKALNRYHETPPKEEDALVGNKNFFDSDMMAHSRRSYLGTVRMLSIRTCRPETLPEYNKNNDGYFLGDGFTTVYVTGKEFGTRGKEIFQAYDWARIPGSTIQYTTEVPKVTTTSKYKGDHSYNAGEFVGGVSNGMEGVAFMDYRRPPLALQAKKSWFFFDDVIVCLGSNINVLNAPEKLNGNPVITTINQVVYSGSYEEGNMNTESENSGNKKTFRSKISKGMWYYHENIGYVPLLEDGDLEMELDKRLIAKKDNEYLETFSLGINHGTRPCNAKYGYAILPAATKDTTEAFAASPTTKVLMEDDIHSVCYIAEEYQVLGAALLPKVAYLSERCVELYSCFPSQVKYLCSNMPVLLMVKSLPLDSDAQSFCPNGVKGLNLDTVTPTSLLQIAVSDPAQVLAYFTLTIKTEIRDFTKKIEVPQGRMAGNTVIKCYKA